MNNIGQTTMSVLGSTGSIGTQALDVARQNNIRVDSLCAGSDYKSVEKQAREFNVRSCAMADAESAKLLKTALSDTNIKVYSGTDGICEMIADSPAEVVLNSIMGKAGLLPTLTAIKSKKSLALANKESLVVAGDIVMKSACENGVDIKPVDSEHCAIYQCLKGNRSCDVKRLWLTASGGPFFGYTKDMLSDITPERALAHPTWSMGAKITIDSATLMNKGFEIIEAAHLFGISPDKIKVLVHRESIIHSAVEYIDNSVIAQMSSPDMRLCIQYALSEPARLDAASAELDLIKIGNLSFAEPDTDTFSLLSCAVNCMKKGGALPAVLNAANEVAVEEFLLGRLSFLGITDVVEETVSRLGNAVNAISLDDILAFDENARSVARQIIASR